MSEETPQGERERERYEPANLNKRVFEQTGKREEEEEEEDSFCVTLFDIPCSCTRSVVSVTLFVTGKTLELSLKLKIPLSSTACEPSSSIFSQLLVLESSIQPIKVTRTRVQIIQFLNLRLNRFEE